MTERYTFSVSRLSKPVTGGPCVQCGDPLPLLRRKRGSGYKTVTEGASEFYFPDVGRVDRRYCSPACRQRAYRQRKAKS